MDAHVFAKKKLNMTKKQILKKRIFYRVFNNKKGFGYISFSNQEKDHVLSVKVILSGSTNVGLLLVENPEYCEMTVAPGEVESVMFLASDIPYNLKLQLLNSVMPRKQKSKPKLRLRMKRVNYVDMLAKLDPKPVEDKAKAEQHVVFSSEVKANQQTFHIKNLSEMVYHINLEFALKNCRFKGSSSKNQIFVLLPNEESSFIVIRIKKSASFKAELTKKEIKVLGC